MKGATQSVNLAEERAESAGEADATKATILIVEDEPGPRLALKVILRPFFNLLIVESAEAALQTLKDHKIDLVTLDLALPGRPGMEVLQEIKRIPEGPEVIIITGQGNLQSALDGLRYGAAGYLMKPFDAMELVSAINQRLQHTRKTVLLDPR